MAQHITNWTVFEGMDRIRVLEAVQIEDKFRQYLFLKKSKKMRQKKIESKVFIQNEFATDTFTENVALILDQKVPDRPLSSFKTTTSLDPGGAIQTVLFLRGFDDHSKVAMPLFMVQIAVQCPSEEIAVHPAVEKVFSAQRIRAIRKMNKSFFYLFDEFRKAQSLKITAFLETNKALKKQIEPKVRSIANGATSIRRCSERESERLWESEDMIHRQRVWESERVTKYQNFRSDIESEIGFIAII